MPVVPSSAMISRRCMLTVIGYLPLLPGPFVNHARLKLTAVTSAR